MNNVSEQGNKKYTQSEDVKADEIEKYKSIYLSQIDENTPQDIKDSPIFNLDDPNPFKLRLTKELVEKYNLKEWFNTYKKEAMVSTAGIRGAQNVLYPWDTRFPLNEMGIALATLGKALVLKEDIKDRDIHKLCSGEVRYNTDRYIEIITRINAAQGIITHLPFDREKTSIWMSSFLIFMNDYDGGEYITSSHAMSSKIATKDLDNQGSQFIPEMSMRFVEKIDEILKKAEEDYYDIELAGVDSDKIVQDFDGIDMYYEYLRKGIATDESLNLIKEQQKNGLEIMYECVGGCIYRIVPKIFEKLGIDDVFVYNNAECDSFFHGIGKSLYNPLKKTDTYFDWGCDVTFPEVIKSIGYQMLLKDKPIGYVSIMIDPDGDRLVLGQIEDKDRAAKLEELGVYYFELDEKRIFAYYMPNQGFFLTMNYYAEQLKKSGLWENHPRFIITTTPSAATWVEWAKNNDVSCIEVPVGFKEIATVMKKVEKQIKDNPQKEVEITDIFGNRVNLGVQPRMLFGGEESGGMITGPEELFKSKSGRLAISMREKSAAEASIVNTAMIAELHKRGITLSEYLEEVFNEHNIKWRYDVRINNIFYNESEPNPKILKKEKHEGEKRRDLTDNFFLSIALSLKENKITIHQAKEIVSEALPNLDFSNLENIYFVGDGTYFRFSDKYIETRKSGTDAVIRGYAAGIDKKECELYAREISGYSGELTPKFKKYISSELYNSCIDRAISYLREFQKGI